MHRVSKDLIDFLRMIHMQNHHHTPTSARLFEQLHQFGIDALWKDYGQASVHS